jgi:hypothetical protein
LGETNQIVNTPNPESQGRGLGFRGFRLQLPETLNPPACLPTGGRRRVGPAAARAPPQGRGPACSSSRAWAWRRRPPPSPPRLLRPPGRPQTSGGGTAPTEKGLKLSERTVDGCGLLGF